MTMRFPIAVLLLLPAAACVDRGSDPVAPAPGSPRPVAAAAQGTGRSGLELIEEDYSGGSLDRESANRYRQYAVSAPDKLPSKYRTGEIGKDATPSMVQMAKEWDSLSPSTKSEILELRAKGFGELKETRETAHFALHFATQGSSAVPAQDADRNGTPDFVDAAAASLEHVWQTEVVALGYPAPKGTPAQKFHVYFRDMAYYGYAMPTNVEQTAAAPVASGTASAYIVIENDFYGFPPNDVDVTGREAVRRGALQVTLAHEFMHAVQFNLNVYQSGWLMESHATWAEDVVYDAVNDWRWYVQSFLRTPDYPLFNRYVYGAAFFQHWLSETRGVEVQRRVWEAARSMSAPDAVRTAALGGSWEEMKAFAPAEYLLGISDYSRDPASVVPTPANLVRASHRAFPVAVTVPASTNRVANRAPWGLGANFVDFVPGPSGAITLAFDGQDGLAWRAYAVATPLRGGPVSVVPIPLDAGSAGSVTLDGFGVRWSKVTLVPTIADRAGAEAPYSYAAGVASATE